MDGEEGSLIVKWRLTLPSQQFPQFFGALIQYPEVHLLESRLDHVIAGFKRDHQLPPELVPFDAGHDYASQPLHPPQHADDLRLGCSGSENFCDAGFHPDSIDPSP